MPFICKPDASNTKSNTFNHCQHHVCKIQPLFHVSLNFAWKMCGLFLIICCVLEHFKPDSAASLRTNFLRLFNYSRKCGKFFRSNYCLFATNIVHQFIAQAACLLEFTEESEDSHRRRGQRNIKSFLQIASFLTLKTVL